MHLKPTAVTQQEEAVSHADSEDDEDWGDWKAPKMDIPSSPPDPEEPLAKRPRNEATPSLVEVFQALRGEDPERIFKVAGIKQLGVHQDAHLRSYFEKYGGVQYIGLSGALRNRGAIERPAATMCFIVMADSRSRNMILNENCHVINGVNVSVRAFWKA